MTKRKQQDPAFWAALSLGLVPGVALALRGALGQLGPEPIAYALNQLGLYALVMLIACLACTPLHWLLRAGWPLRIRKTLGNLSFGYAALHLSTYVGVDQFFDFAAIGRDLLKRPFIWVGMGTFLILLALAATSPQRALRRLGFRRWKRLHRLVYVAGAGACLHYFWRFKTRNVPGPWIAFALVLALLLARLVHALATRRPAAAELGKRGATQG